MGGEIAVTQFAGHDSLKWLVVLLLGTSASAFGTLATNGVTVQRPHNSIRLWSECLANQQLTYVAFFFSLLAAFNLTEDYKNLCFLETFVCLIFFIVGMINVRGHGKSIAADHRSCPDDCTRPLSATVRWRLLGWNTVLATISLLIVLGLVLSLGQARVPAPPGARVSSGSAG